MHFFIKRQLLIPSILFIFTSINPIFAFQGPPGSGSPPPPPGDGGVVRDVDVVSIESDFLIVSSLIFGLVLAYRKLNPKKIRG